MRNPACSDAVSLLFIYGSILLFPSDVVGSPLYFYYVYISLIPPSFLFSVISARPHLAQESVESKQQHIETKAASYQLTNNGEFVIFVLPVCLTRACACRNILIDWVALLDGSRSRNSSWLRQASIYMHLLCAQHMWSLCSNN